LLDPLGKDFHFPRRQPLTTPAWWHHLMIVIRRDPSQDLARTGLTGDDGPRSRRKFAEGLTPIIQSQITPSRLFIRTMTQEAIFRQNRPNLFGIVDRRGRFGT